MEVTAGPGRVYGVEECVCELRRRWGAAHSKRLCSDFVVPLLTAASGARLPTS